MSIIQAIKPKCRNLIKNVQIELINEENRPLLWRITGMASDGYDDVYNRVNKKSELNDFFGDLYYGDENVSTRMQFIEIHEHVQHTAEYVIVLKPYANTNQTVFSNALIFVKLNVDGFSTISHQELKNYIGVEKHLK